MVPSPMITPATMTAPRSRNPRLSRVAHDAMRDARPPARVLAGRTRRSRRVHGARPAADAAVRDLRGLALGLDRQRRLARSRSALGRGRAADGAETIWSPSPTSTRWSRRARRSTITRGQHDVGLHRGRDLPDAAGEALDRPHVAQPGRGPARGRGRDDGRRRRRGSRRRRSTARAVRNHAKLAYNGVAAWLEGDAPAPAAARGGARASTSSCASRTASRRR